MEHSALPRIVPGPVHRSRRARDRRIAGHGHRGHGHDALDRRPRGRLALPIGGSQSIIDYLVADLEAHGGTVHTDARIDHVSDMPAARAYLLDTSALNAAQIFSGLIPSHVDKALRSFKHGNAAAKVDFVLDGPAPGPIPRSDVPALSTSADPGRRWPPPRHR